MHVCENDGVQAGRRVVPFRWQTAFCTGVAALMLHSGHADAQQKRIYIANDDHTDYLWSGDESAYRDAFITMLDYYLRQADSTINDPPDFQGRFNTDGHFWIWTYEKNKPLADFLHLIERIRDGHISVPLHLLVLCYGGMPAEAVIRSMYYAGRLERRHGLRLELVSEMENHTLPYGVISLWAGAGARYSWKGVCGCATRVTGLENREREIYRAIGPDGRSILMKWHSLTNNASSGGYAEARSPSQAVTFASSDPVFLSRYPFDQVVGMFGKGWDDLQTLTDEFPGVARSMTTDSCRVIVSNEIDFFRDFEASAPADSVPSFSGGFGNEWAVYSASMAEVASSVKRAVEDLRSAEALAAIVSLHDPTFWSSRSSSADSAATFMGLYYEHDWTMDGPASSGRPEFQRRVASQIQRYVQSLLTDARDALSTMIHGPASETRFYVFNPLGWTRTDVADVAINPSGPFRVIDRTTGMEVRSQRMTRDGHHFVRILAEKVPPVGYRVYEFQSGTTQFSDSAAAFSNGNATFENSHYRVTVNGRGAIAGLIDKTDGSREWVQSIGGRQMNDLGSGAGTPAPENVGPVSATVRVNASGTLSHTARVTLYSDVDRIDIDNEITSGFGNSVTTYSFGFNIAGYTVRHEEVGGIAVAKKISQGGNYADQNGRYEYLTMNHFVDLSNSQRGMTLSNRDGQFFRLGSSYDNTIDATTPQVNALVGGRFDGLGASNQDGDTYFLSRYALLSHGSYDQSAAMRMALEHQNPFVVSPLTGAGGAPLPDTECSFVSISDSGMILWALKPAEEGISDGVIARVWNVSGEACPFTLELHGALLSGAQKATHIETNLEPASVAGNALTDLLPSQWMQTYRLNLTPVPVSVNRDDPIVPEQFMLRNYPNPFNPTTCIEYTLGGVRGQGPGVSEVRLVVYDLLGREVAVLVNERKPAGSYHVRFNAAGLSSGVYVCRLTAGSLTRVAKLALIR